MDILSIIDGGSFFFARTHAKFNATGRLAESSVLSSAFDSLQWPSRNKGRLWVSRCLARFVFSNHVYLFYSRARPPLLPVKLLADSLPHEYYIKPAPGRPINCQSEKCVYILFLLILIGLKHLVHHSDVT